MTQNVNNKCDIVFSFDTTGSMSSCIAEVRKNVAGVVKNLIKDIPGIRIGIVAHGDYCDEKTSYLMKQIDLTTNVDSLVNFVKNVENTGGGDYPEAYEYVLHKVQELKWDPSAVKTLVMIGDAIPHAADKNPHKLDWRTEVEELSKMGVKIFSVQALASKRGEAYTFYKQMANKTGGYHLFLDQFSHILNMVMAICYQHQSVERVEQFENEVKESVGQNNMSMKKMFDTLLKRKGEADDVDPAEDYNPEDDKIVPCPPAKYQVLNIDGNSTIKEFVTRNGLMFKAGKGFYEFTKPEIISDKKQIVLMKKDTGELFEGRKARKIANITSASKRRSPSELKDYKVFVQSTSHSRKLIGGTSFLYQALDWVE